MKRKMETILERRAMALRVPRPLHERLERQRAKDYAGSLSQVALRALALGIAELERQPSLYEQEQTAR
jgi:hypothetical protein